AASAAGRLSLRPASSAAPLPPPSQPHHSPGSFLYLSPIPWTPTETRCQHPPDHQRLGAKSHTGPDRPATPSRKVRGYKEGNGGSGPSSPGALCPQTGEERGASVALVPTVQVTAAGRIPCAPHRTICCHPRRDPLMTGIDFDCPCCRTSYRESDGSPLRP